MRHQAIGILLFAALPVAVQATTLTFDDLSSPPSLTAIPNGYGGLTWVNMGVITTPSYCAPCGYQNGTVSGSYVAYNSNGAPSSFKGASAFSIQSFYLTAAWNDGLTVSVTGKLAGSTVQSTSFVVNTSGPTLETLNWSGVDEIDFASSGGVTHAGYSGSGTHFALDNLTINAVPEPEAIAMMLAGLGLVGAVARRSRRI